MTIDEQRKWCDKHIPEKLITNPVIYGFVSLERVCYVIQNNETFCYRIASPQTVAKVIAATSMKGVEKDVGGLMIVFPANIDVCSLFTPQERVNDYGKFMSM